MADKKYKHIINFPEYDHEDVEFMSVWGADGLEWVASEYLEMWFWNEPSDRYLNKDYEISVDDVWFVVSIEPDITVYSRRKDG